VRRNLFLTGLRLIDSRYGQLLGAISHGLRRLFGTGYLA
jgi:hypothetical protein